MAELKTIPISSIKIPDVRVSSILDDEQKAFLASTIKEIGVVQDPIVRPLQDGSYELVAGRSRILELQNQGAKEIQVKVIDAEEKTALMMNIIENVARGTYDYISISKTIRKLKHLGTTPEELERVFPWSKRWIEFLEGLQDLPDDLVAALQAKKITPTHIMYALNLPTPYEVHSGLRSAINLSWDTATFKTFVQNRVEQIERAKQQAAAQGIEPTIPEAVPEQLVQYKQCLLCGYQKPREQVNATLVCEACATLVKYLVDQLGPPENAINDIYGALKVYFGDRSLLGAAAPSSKEASAQP